MRSHSTRIAVCLCAVLMTGCGDGMLKTRGRVVKNGAPFTLKEGEDLGIFFYPLTLMAFAFGIAMYKSSGKAT